MRFVPSILTCAALALNPTALLAQQADYDPSGWRAADGYEKKMRKAFEGGRDGWSKADGEDEMYDCMLAWAIWGDTARNASDEIPTIAGDLTHSFSDGQLSHYVNALLEKAEGDAEVFAQGVVNATLRIEDSEYLNGEDKAFYKFLGKCYVEPTSWNFSLDVTITGPVFMREILDQPASDVYPPYVRYPEDRAVFDQYILDKDFVAAANFAADLHAFPEKKSTVYWNEVLTASRIAIGQGRGTQLSDALLKTLSEVWWPKSNRQMAAGILRAKHGGSQGSSSSSSSTSHVPDEPAWAKQEYDRFLRGETNYTPCNMWHDTFC